MGMMCPKSANNAGGFGNPDAKLVVLMDDPGHVQSEKLLIWMFKKLGLTGNDVWVDYTFKCQIPKGLKKNVLRHCYEICWSSHPRKEALEDRALVIAGNYGADFVLQQKMKEMNGRKDEETGAWIIYSFSYALMNPAICVDIWRVLFKAAQEAGLEPRMVIDVEPFRFPSKKLAGA